MKTYHSGREGWDMRRRQMLSGAITTVAAGLTGCLDTVPFDDEQRYHLEVIVQNNHDRPYEVRTTVTDAEESVVFEDAFTLDSGESREISDDVPAGEYSIVVELADRSESRSYWNTDLCDAYRVRTETAADESVSHHAICHSGDGGPGEE